MMFRPVLSKINVSIVVLVLIGGASVFGSATLLWYPGGTEPSCPDETDWGWCSGCDGYRERSEYFEYAENGPTNAGTSTGPNIHNRNFQCSYDEEIDFLQPVSTSNTTGVSQTTSHQYSAGLSLTLVKDVAGMNFGSSCTSTSSWHCDTGISVNHDIKCTSLWGNLTGHFINWQQWKIEYVGYSKRKCYRYTTSGWVFAANHTWDPLKTVTIKTRAPLGRSKEAIEHHCEACYSGHPTCGWDGRCNGIGGLEGCYGSSSCPHW